MVPELTATAEGPAVAADTHPGGEDCVLAFKISSISPILCI